MIFPENDASFGIAISSFKFQLYKINILIFSETEQKQNVIMICITIEYNIPLLEMSLTALYLEVKQRQIISYYKATCRTIFTLGDDFSFKSCNWLRIFSLEK